jgi:hypothetical protein
MVAKPITDFEATLIPSATQLLGDLVSTLVSDMQCEREHT